MNQKDWPRETTPKAGAAGVIQILFLLILLAGIIGGLYLVSHPTIFKPKASNEGTRIEIVDDKGTPITTTTTTKVKVQVTFVPLQRAERLGISTSKPLAQAPGTTDGTGQFRGAGTISANPNPVPAGSGLGTTIITWSGVTDTGQVRVFEPAGTPGAACTPTNKCLFAQGSSGSQDATWITPGHTYIFDLYNGPCAIGDEDCSDQTLVSSVTVTQTPTSTPLPTPSGTSIPPSPSPTPTPIFPEAFRVANSEKELSSAPEHAFTGNPTTIDWILDSGAGVKTVYAQFKLGGFWGGLVKSSIELTGTPPPFKVSLSADPTVVISGKQTTLTWTIVGAVKSCDWSLGVSDGISALGGQPSPVITSGSKTITLTNSTDKPLTQTFTLGCSDGNGNSAQSSANIVVLPISYPSVCPKPSVSPGCNIIFGDPGPNTGSCPQYQLTCPSIAPSPSPISCTPGQYAASFGSSRGSNRYNPSCDSNNDGIINIVDSSILFPRAIRF